MNILNKITIFLKKNKKNIFYTLFFVSIFVFSFDIVGAETGTISTGDPDLDGFIKLFNGFIAIISVLMTMLTAFIGIFLHPEWTSGAVIGLSEPLKNLWILVSNVVYLLFAFLFIWIAFMNIIGREDIYQLKQAIPKFIVGVLIVPFSWFFVQFIISLSSILTASILSLPVDMIGDKNIEVQNCSHFQLKTVTSVEDVESMIKCEGGKEQKNIKELLTGEGIYSIMDIYTYNVMKLDQLTVLKEDDIKLIKTISDLVLKIGFNFIFAIIYAILVIALGLALFVRGVYLWFFAMLSPVFGLLFFFGKKDGTGDGVSKNFNIKEFIALSLVPVYVSAALAFGLIFIIVAGQNTGDTGTKIKIYTGPDEGDKSISAITIGNGDKSIVWTGKYLGDSDLVLGGFKGAFGSLLAQLFGIVFLWIAVIAALKQSTITQNVVEPFDSFGKQIGGLIQKAPTYAPVIPGVGSAQALQKIGSMPISALETRASNEASVFQPHINKVFGGNTINPSDLANLRNMWRDGIDQSELGTIQNKIKELISQYGTENRQVQELIKEYNLRLKGSSLHVQDENNLMDSSGKLKQAGVGILFGNLQTNALQAIDSSRASQFAEANFRASQNKTKDISQEGEAGSLASEYYNNLQKGSGSYTIKTAGDDGKEKNIRMEIKQSSGGVNYAIDDEKTNLHVKIDSNGYAMTFGSQSKEAFTKTTLVEVKSNLSSDDFNELRKILSKLSHANQQELLKRIFDKARNDINQNTLGEFMK